MKLRRIMLVSLLVTCVCFSVGCNKSKTVVVQQPGSETASSTTTSTDVATTATATSTAEVPAANASESTGLTDLDGEEIVASGTASETASTTASETATAPAETASETNGLPMVTEPGLDNDPLIVQIKIEIKGELIPDAPPDAVLPNPLPQPAKRAVIHHLYNSIARMRNKVRNDAKDAQHHINDAKRWLKMLRAYKNVADTRLVAWAHHQIKKWEEKLKKDNK
jgi:hypothetical protein